MKLREIERLRALAAILVLCVHWEPLQKFLPAMLHDPWSGVDLFFVISGFVVTLSLVRLLPPLEAEPSFIEAFSQSRAALKAFYVRRFFRIMPAALTVALLTGLMTGIFPGDFGTKAEWRKELIGFFGGIYNYMFAFGRGAPWQLSVYWSLAVEEHFYLLLPALFIVFRTTNRRLAASAGVALFSILCRAFTHSADTPLASSEDMYCSHSRFDSLMAGVALALVLGHLKTAAPGLMPRKLMRFVLLPAAMVLLACLPAAAPVYVLHHAGFIALWTISGVLVAYASLDRGYVLSVPLLGRFLEYLGARSYAIYLTHWFVKRVESGVRGVWPQYAAFAPESAKPVMQLLVLCVVTFIASDLLHRVVERPFMRLGRRIIDAHGTFTLSKLGRRLTAVGLAALLIFYFRHPIMLAIGSRDLAHGRLVNQSSHGDDSLSPRTLVNGALESEGGVSTKSEEHPWEMVDLGTPTQIGAIRIYSCADQGPDRSLPLEVQVSDDDLSYETIAVREHAFTQEWPWRIHSSTTTARYVRFMVMEKTAMCLSEVEIFRSRAMAEVP